MRIEKRSYSRQPWRLVTDDGREVYVKVDFNHPDLGATAYEAPVSGDTRTEVVEKAMKLLDSLFFEKFVKSA